MIDIKVEKPNVFNDATSLNVVFGIYNLQPNSKSSHRPFSYGDMQILLFLSPIFAKIDADNHFSAPRKLFFAAPGPGLKIPRIKPEKPLKN